MKLTVLGNRSPYPVKEAGCSGYLLQVEGKNILLDIGSGVLSNLDRLIDYHQLDAIIISHLHEDHWLDLYPLHYAVKFSLDEATREEPLSVYLPFTDGVELDYLKNKVGEEYELQPIEEAVELEIGPTTVKFKETDHSKECYAVRLEYENKGVGYTADTAYQRELVDFLSDVDLLIAEASLLEKDKSEELKHMTVKEAVQFGRETKAEKVLLTHLGSNYNKKEIKTRISQESKEEISEILKTYQV